MFLSYLYVYLIVWHNTLRLHTMIYDHCHANMISFIAFTVHHHHLIIQVTNVVFSNDDGRDEIQIQAFYIVAGDSVVLSTPAQNEPGTDRLTSSIASNGHDTT